MATDSQLKQGRRTLQTEIKRLQELVELDALLGENIKEKVLDSEIKVKRQELEAIKHDIATAAEQWRQERDKREMEAKAEVGKLSKYLTEKQREHETGLTELKTKVDERETFLKTVIRNTEQRISQAQKKADEGVQEIAVNAESKKRELKEELVGLAELRDSMKEEIRAMQNKYLGVRV